MLSFVPINKQIHRSDFIPETSTRKEKERINSVVVYSETGGISGLWCRGNLSFAAQITDYQEVSNIVLTSYIEKVFNTRSDRRGKRPREVTHHPVTVHRTSGAMTCFLAY